MRTLAGKKISSRNAFLHGLLGPLPLDPAALGKIESIASVLVGEDADQTRLTSDTEFIEAQLELLRIRSVRAEQVAAIGSDHSDTKKIGRLASLDRYEKLAHTKRRRASYKL
jgi:hypothetical protein